MKQETQKKIERRLKIIAGQVRGLQKMIEQDKYCVDFITQASAVRQALASVEDIMLEKHLSTHVVEQMRGPDAEKAIKEILDIHKLARKK